MSEEQFNELVKLFVGTFATTNLVNVISLSIATDWYALQNLANLVIK